MATSKKQIMNNIKKIPSLDQKKIIIVGLSDECFLAAEILQELSKDVYAYASDDLMAVTRLNKNNVIFAEKWFGDDVNHVIKVLPFGEALVLENAIYLLAANHYEKQFITRKYKKQIDFFRINEVTK